MSRAVFDSSKPGEHLSRAVFDPSKPGEHLSRAAFDNLLRSPSLDDIEAWLAEVEFDPQVQKQCLKNLVQCGRKCLDYKDDPKKLFECIKKCVKDAVEEIFGK